MKRIAYAAAIAVLSTGVLFLFASAAEEHQHNMKMETGKPVTLVGEVIDLYCYTADPAGGRGPAHAKCAQTCIRNGLPIGYLSNGKVYLIVGEKDHANAKDLVVDFAGKESRVTGTLIERDGINALQIDKIDNVAPPSKP